MKISKPDQLEPLIRSGHLGNVYLFDGPEKWLKERTAEKILNKLVPPESRDFNYNRYSGRNATAAEIVSTAQSLPFLGEKRLLIVDETEEFSAAENKIIGEGIGNLPDTTCLIFFYDGKARLKEEIPAQVSSAGDIITFWAPFENQIPSWISGEVRNQGKSMDFAAARLLADVTTDLQELAGEINKLVLFVGDKNTITRDDVLQFGLPDGKGDYKDFEDALWNRDLAEALRQGELMGELGIRPESLFPVVERVFRSLLMGRYKLSVQKRPAATVYQELGFRGKLAQEKFNRGSRNYREEELVNAFDHISNADYEMKRGVLPPRIAVSLLLTKLLDRENLRLR